MAENTLFTGDAPIEPPIPLVDSWISQLATFRKTPEAITDFANSKLGFHEQNIDVTKTLTCYGQKAMCISSDSIA